MASMLTPRSHSPRWRAALLIALTAALGSPSAILGEEPTVAYRPLEIRTILVARDTIPARFVIQPAMLVSRPMPDDGSLSAAITDPAQLVGQVTEVWVEAGQAFTEDVLLTAEENDAQRIFSILDPTETIRPYHG